MLSSPLGRGGVIILAAFPMLILIVVIADLFFRDGEYGIPATIGAAVAIALGPVIYRIAQCSNKSATI